jgi:hypothetical protein
MCNDALRCIIEIEVIDRNEDESLMRVTVKPHGQGLGHSYTELLPVTVEDWYVLHEIVKTSPDLPKWLAPEQIIDPDTN